MPAHTTLSTDLNLALAQTHHNDLRRAAANHNRSRRATTRPTGTLGSLLIARRNRRA